MLFQRGLEVVEVHHHQIEGLDVEFLKRLHVFRHVLVGENAAVYARVQGFHTAVQNFRKAGDFAHGRHGKALFLQEFHGAAGGNQLDALFVKKSGEFRKPVLMRHAQKSALDGKKVHRNPLDDMISYCQRSGQMASAAGGNIPGTYRISRSFFLFSYDLPL